MAYGEFYRPFVFFFCQDGVEGLAVTLDETGQSPDLSIFYHDVEDVDEFRRRYSSPLDYLDSLLWQAKHTLEEFDAEASYIPRFRDVWRDKQLGDQEVPVTPPMVCTHETFLGNSPVTWTEAWLERATLESFEIGPNPQILQYIEDGKIPNAGPWNLCIQWTEGMATSMLFTGRFEVEVPEELLPLDARERARGAGLVVWFDPATLDDPNPIVARVELGRIN